MAKEFKINFQARWADMDFNGHMRNTAFLEYAADSRMLYFKENGFPLATFAKLQIGPVVFSDTIRYFNELFMYDEFSVKLMLKETNKNGSKFTFINEFKKTDHTLAASIESKACWLDLKNRKVVAPPEKLFNIIQNLEHTDDFRLSD